MHSWENIQSWSNHTEHRISMHTKYTWNTKNNTGHTEQTACLKYTSTEITQNTEQIKQKAHRTHWTCRNSQITPKTRGACRNYTQNTWNIQDALHEYLSHIGHMHWTHETHQINETCRTHWTQWNMQNNIILNTMKHVHPEHTEKTQRAHTETQN